MLCYFMVMHLISLSFITKEGFKGCPHMQDVKLSVNEQFRPHWMRYASFHGECVSSGDGCVQFLQSPCAFRTELRAVHTGCVCVTSRTLHVFSACCKIRQKRILVYTRSVGLVLFVTNCCA